MCLEKQGPSFDLENPVSGKAIFQTQSREEKSFTSLTTKILKQEFLRKIAIFIYFV